MTIHEYFWIHDTTYMRFKSLIHALNNTWKFNTWRMSPHNPNPAIKDLLQKKVMDKYGIGLKKDTEFVVDDETVARYSNI